MHQRQQYLQIIDSVVQGTNVNAKWSLSAQSRHKRGVEIQLPSFLPTKLDEGSVQHRALLYFPWYPRNMKRVGPRASMSFQKREKSLTPTRIRTPNHRARNVVSVVTTLIPSQRVLMNSITRSQQAIYVQSMNQYYIICFSTAEVSQLHVRLGTE